MCLQIKNSIITPQSFHEIEMESKQVAEKETAPFLLIPQLLAKSLFLAYSHMPLPLQARERNYLILNPSRGGFGDFAIAAKIIEVIGKFDPHATIHWSVDKTESCVKEFLDPLLNKKIRVRVFSFNDNESGFSPTEKIDAVLYTPLHGLSTRDSPYLKEKFKLDSSVKILFIREIGLFDRSNLIIQPSKDLLKSEPPIKVKCYKDTDEESEILITNTSNNPIAYSALSALQRQLVIANLINGVVTTPVFTHEITSGLDETSGFFITKKEMERKEEEEQSEEERLFIQLQAMQSIEKENVSLYRQIHSGRSGSREFHETHLLGYGYAHQTAFKMHFLDIISGQSNEKNAIVILAHRDRGQKEEETPFSYFTKKMLSEERLAFLKTHCYGKVICRLEGHEDLVVTIDADKSRSLLVILLEKKVDENIVRQLQKAADFQLVTGNSTPFEILAHNKCLRFYMFDDVSCKKDQEDTFPYAGHAAHFLKQQIRIASQVYPPLGKFLKISSQLKKLTPEDRDSAIALSQDPKIPMNLKKFATKVTSEFDICPVVEGMIKRHLIEELNPEILNIEERAIIADSEITKTFEDYYFKERNPSVASYTTTQNWSDRLTRKFLAAQVLPKNSALQDTVFSYI